MARYLVVGNQTLLSRELMDVLRERATGGEDCHIHVVVPQTPLDHYRFPIKPESYRFSASTSRVETVAEHQLAVALEEFKSLDASVTGAIGHEHPLTAVRQAVAEADYDEIVLSTFPEQVSRWLGTGLTGQLHRHVHLPVTHVVSHPEHHTQDRRRYEEVLRQLRTTEA